MIRVEQLSHSFGKTEVLKNISFQVEDGEILAVMGSSGGGKTTLLRCIAGLITPSSGKVLLGDIHVASQPDLARGKMGMVFQSAAGNLSKSRPARPFQLGRHSPPEIFGQHCNIAFTNTQWRQRDNLETQPVQQVGAKPVGIDHARQILVRCTNNAHIDPDRAR